MVADRYQEEDDEDYSQYRFVKSRFPKKEEKRKTKKFDWDDDYGYQRQGR